MKSVPSPPAQPQPMNNPLPHWSELPLTRQQELITLLATLLLRQWTTTLNTPPEVQHDACP